MQSEDGRVVLTFNGEIYNFAELRSELAAKGYRFKGQSDTEVLLAGYLAQGTAILDRLNGIFAFAIHDARSGELFIARDQMGVKPLYYAQTKAGFVFASEIKALLRLADIDRALDFSAIRRYMAFLWCPGEQTPFKQVKKLAPGSAMIVSNGEVARRWIYWRAPPYAPRFDWTAQQCAAELAELLGACVHRQMVSDAPLGAFLSGGIDSSAIVAAACRSKPDLHCFTIELAGGAEQGTVDDLPYARAVAAHLGVTLDAIRIDAPAMCSKALQMVELLDEPLADPACLNVLFISEFARRQGIKVLLSGVGGDDLFTGYRRHTLLACDSLWAHVPLDLRRWLVELFASADRRHGGTRRLARLLEVAAQDGARRITSSFIWGPTTGVDGLLSPDVATALTGEEVAAPLIELIQQIPAMPATEKCLMLEKRFFLADHNLIYTDKMAMAAGVEVRVPFLDRDLINFAATIPWAWKHKFFKPKWILKQSQKRVLPAPLINRPKAGFGAPLRRWMKHEMQDLVRDLLSPSTINRRGLFDARAVQQLLRSDAEGQVDASYTLFSLMCIELWCRRFIDAPSNTLERAT